MAGFEDLFSSALNMANAAVTSPLASVLGVKSPAQQVEDEAGIAGAVNNNPTTGGGFSVSPLVIGGAVVVLVLVVVLIRGRR